MNPKDSVTAPASPSNRIPESILAYMGCPDFAKNVDPHAHGYPSYMPRALEREQLERSILVCDETVDYLYNAYSPTKPTYVAGTRPLLEKIVNTVCRDGQSDGEKARALVRWRRANIQHIGVCGLGTEEEILLGGYSMCHDAARTLVILCQVAGIGARLVIGLNKERGNGHTLTEVFVEDGWKVFDPSPGMPFAWLEDEQGALASGWDVHRDPSLPTRCVPEFNAPRGIRDYGTYFRDYRLVNYSIEESTRNMAQRFLHMITAQKILQNYDYTGHLNHPALSSFADFDDMAEKWIHGTLNPTPKRYA